MNDLVKQLRIKAGVIEMGERIAFGSETSLMFKAADEIESLQAYIDHALVSSKVKQQAERIAEFEKNQAIRDLEQQAKGVEKAADVREINWTSGDRHTLHLLAKDLREQTKALRGEG